ncbi:molybdenum cofactor biosynthesis protein MoaE [Congregibacter litoralis]|uniref:Molybdopterin synthase catalytic subunit n=1 Tax=Congregibacter litoralis KT71 TaxID=314285 RepID=A4A3E0_9GAMM|nr:molybdenum cofactor biosynthesis protein MoaE [Congregibacter litoralis]EAQ99213.1 molybdopterin synthase subunit MoaE [Congregibacter litoralis KT71]
MFSVDITASPIDVTGLTRDFPRSPNGTGAVASFTGFVRGEGITALALEHYPGMTERSIMETIESAARRWPVQAVQVVHRVGELKPGEPIVWLAVGSGHRAAAFSACEFVMDYLKVSAPLWKRERDTKGSWHWVKAKSADDDRAKRWSRGATA